MLKSSQTFIHQLLEAEFKLQQVPHGMYTTTSSSQHTHLTGLLHTGSLNFEDRSLFPVLLSQVNCSNDFRCTYNEYLGTGELDTALLLLQSPSSHSYPFLHLPALKVASPFLLPPEFSTGQSPHASGLVLDAYFWGRFPQAAGFRPHGTCLQSSPDRLNPIRMKQC